MPSTITRMVGARVSHRTADDLALAAAASGRSVSRIIAEAIDEKLRELRHETHAHD